MHRHKRPSTDYDDLVRHPAKEWNEALRATFEALCRTRHQKASLHHHLADLEETARKCGDRSVPVDNASDIYTFFIYSVVTAGDLEPEFDKVMAAWQEQPGRPVYLLKYRQRCSPHFVILCGTTCHHLTDLPVAVTWGARYTTFQLSEHPRFLSIELVGHTTLSDAAIADTCRGAVASSHHYAFFNCQNYAQRCLERICLQSPDIHLDWASARAARWLLRWWPVMLILMFAVCSALGVTYNVSGLS